MRCCFLALAFLALTSCGRSEVTGPTPLTSIESLVAALHAQGAAVSRGAALIPESHPYFSGEAQTLLVNGENVIVFEYANRAAAEGDVAQVSPTGSGIGQSLITWIGPPHFYHRDTLIVLYVGSDAAVLGPLTAVLGEPFAPR
jgi:hypothetical protein